ncbi:MAG: ABC transporter ATP-binding protein [Thaumarchaeota archaeon]|nr:ABC transporter ATP-binding protein [Candidatus Calditenuaceae archaeon]MDW8041216.1 ABC transporter ATP-binding protein [Nitrososphaerota archaeon]
MTELVRMEDVTFAYTNSRTPVLQAINVHVDYAEFVGIVGPSGCGKSTLLRLMSGLLKPTSGRVLFRGEPLNGPNQRISMMFQSPTLLPWLTVIDNVVLPLRARRDITDEQRSELAMRFLDLTGLSGYERAYPRELSGGMQQRVALARALISLPDLLLLDEPFSNLDPLTALALIREIEHMWYDSSLPPASVVLVSHNVDEIVQLSDRIIVLKGRPATVTAEIKVELERPRVRRSPEFLSIVDDVIVLMGN